MMKYIVITLYLYCGSLTADFTVDKNNDLNPGTVQFGANYYDYPIKCTQILDEFALRAANFTKCSIEFAKPIRLCERCIDHYMEFQKKYEELLNTVVNGTSCKSLFISHDRLDVVLEYYNSILYIWNKGNCNDCYVWSKNTSDTPILSNNTIRFNKMYNATIRCILDNLTPNSNDSNQVCKNCMQPYLQLDEFYKSLSVDSIGVDSICMDIVDSMNSTRSIWSKSLNCCKLRQTPEIIFLCCTGIISLLPLLYYVAVRFCGPIRDLPNVLKQSRFKQSILRSVQERFN